MKKKLKFPDGHKYEDIRCALRDCERRYSTKPAFLEKVSGRYRETSYSELIYNIDGLGTELYFRGYLGSKIILIGDNSVNWATVYLTVVSGLGVIVPVDKEIPTEELCNIANKTGASAVFYSPRLEEKVNALPDCVQKFSLHSLSSLVSLGAGKLLSGKSDYLRLKIDPDALALILFTSGTTSTMKGVMLSHKNICYVLSNLSRMIECRSDDVFLSVLPMHHVYEASCGFLYPLVSGACVAFCEGLRYISRNMQEVRPTVMLCVPVLAQTMYKKIWFNIKKRGSESKVRRAIRLSGNLFALKKILFKEIHDTLGGRLRLLICGGAAADPEVLGGLCDLGILAIQGYGLTECAPLVSVNTTSLFKHSSAGLPLPDSVVDIYNADSEGNGEIRYKGENIMLGYFADKDATDEVLRDGWLYTGDLGYIDDDGFLHITGRKKNVIVTSGGKNIFPEELESYLCRNKFVSDAVVVGYINESKGDFDIVAVLRPDVAAFEEAYGKGFSRGQVEAEFNRAVAEVNSIVQHYKMINYFVIRNEEFAYNSSRKIKRAGVANEAKAEYLRKLARI